MIHAVSKLYYDTGNGFTETSMTLHDVSENMNLLIFYLHEAGNIKRFKWKTGLKYWSFKIEEVTLIQENKQRVSIPPVDIDPIDEKGADEETFIMANPVNEQTIRTVEIRFSLERWDFDKLVHLYEIEKNDNQRYQQKIEEMKESFVWKWGNKIKSVLRIVYHPMVVLVNRMRNRRKKLNIKTRMEIKRFKNQPLITFVMPVYNVEPDLLKKALRSIKQQSYKKWELCIVDDGSTNKRTLKYLHRINHPNMHILLLPENKNISIATNHAIDLASGAYIAFIDNDDTLNRHALFLMVKRINETEADILYSDEDKIEMNGRYVEPHLKPDYNSELLLSMNYMSHFTMIKTSIVEAIGGLRKGYEGSQDHDLFLRAVERTNRIQHIPHVLYHWRKIPGSTAAEYHSKHYAWEAGRKAVEDAIVRRGIPGKVNLGPIPGTYRVNRELLEKPFVSIIIPFKDSADFLETSVGSVLNSSSYPNYEIIGMNHRSELNETHLPTDSLMKNDKRIRFIDWKDNDPFSTMMNTAVDYANGNYIIFMNHKAAVITPDWIEQLLQYAQYDDVGAVGAKLYYPDNTVQHAGVIVGADGTVDHAHRNILRESPGYFGRAVVSQEVSAVSLALMMVRKSLFKDIGGFSHDLQNGDGGIEFCGRLRQEGYKIIFNPYCEMYFYRSKNPE